jgi:hypothetical protein
MVVSIVGRVWGPFEFGARVFDRVVAYDPASVRASQVAARVVAVEFHPVPGHRSTLEGIRDAQPGFRSGLASDLAGCVRAFAKGANDTSATAAFVFGAADRVGPHEVYLYGDFYHRQYRGGEESGSGFQAVRLRVDPRAGSGRTVAWMEIEPVDTRPGSAVGRPIDGPYPRWVDKACLGGEQDMRRLLGPE